MSARKRGLGRGLDALLATSQSSAQKEQDAAEVNSTNGELSKLPIEYLVPKATRAILKSSFADILLHDELNALRSGSRSSKHRDGNVQRRQLRRSQRSAEPLG